jgi:F-type H+-transporting ATPase subunit delta
MYAQKNEQEDRVYNEVVALGKSFVQYPALHRVVTNLMLSSAKKAEVIATISGGAVSKSFANFIKLLAERDREEFLQEICLSYQHIYRREKKLLNVKLATVAPVDKEVEERIVRKLEAATGCHATLITSIDPSLLGGYVLSLDTYRLDVSVATRLQRVKRRLIETANNS